MAAKYARGKERQGKQSVICLPSQTFGNWEKVLIAWLLVTYDYIIITPP